MAGRADQVALLLPGSGDDQCWNASAVAAMSRLKSLGIRATCVQEVASPAAPALLAEYSAKDARLIVGHGCEYIAPVLAIAGRHPETCYFVMDQPPSGIEIPTNVAFLHQRQQEPAFLCGRLAAWLTTSKVVGFIGGLDVPTQRANCQAFTQGVRSISEQVTVVAEYAGSFEDRTKGQALAQQLIGAGSDVIMQTADTTGLGAIDVCREQGVRVMGYIIDQAHLAPGLIATSLVVDVPAIVERKAREALAGSFESGVWRVGLAEGLVKLAPIAEFVSQDARSDIAATSAAIASGRIQIP